MSASVREKLIAQFTNEVQQLEAALSDLKNPSAGIQLDEMISRYMLMHPTASYTEAMNAVLKQNPELAREFGSLTNPEFATTHPWIDFALKE